MPRERATDFPPAVAAAIETFRGALRGRFGDRLADLRLFGPYARDEARPESDVDILVVVAGLARHERRGGTATLACGVAEPEKALLDQLYLVGRGRARLALHTLDLSPVDPGRLRTYARSFPPSVQAAVQRVLAVRGRGRRNPRPAARTSSPVSAAVAGASYHLPGARRRAGPRASGYL